LGVLQVIKAFLRRKWSDPGSGKKRIPALGLNQIHVRLKKHFYCLALKDLALNINGSGLCFCWGRSDELAQQEKQAPAMTWIR
jgi:hypothetical protein